MLHASKTWPLTKPSLQCLQRIDRAMIRQICNVKPQDVLTTRSGELLVRVCIEYLDLILNAKRLRWYGHVEPSSGAVKRAFDIQVDGKHGPRRPSTCMSKALLTAPLERSTCPYQLSLFSFRMSSYSMETRTSSSLVLVVTMSCGLTLQICLIIALSICCRHWRFGFVNGHVLLAWSIALYTQHLYTWPHVLKERWQEERTGSSSLNFFQAVFTCVVIESSQPSAAESMSPR